MPKNGRIWKYCVFALKIVISGLILHYLLKKTDLRDIKDLFTSIPVSTICLILFIAVLKELTQIINWGHYLILNPEYKKRRREIVRSYFAGLALRFVLPGGIATLGKVYFVENRKRQTLLSIGFERFFQTWTAFFLASLAGFFYFTDISIYLRITLIVVIFTIPFLVSSIRYFKLKLHWNELLENYNIFLPRIMAIQLLYFSLTVVQYFIILRTFLDIPFSVALISVPLILFANVIPITFAGLGLRETFAVEVLSSYSIIPEIALTASLGIFFINSVLPALPGIWFILSTRQKFKVSDRSEIT